MHITHQKRNKDPGIQFLGDKLIKKIELSKSVLGCQNMFCVRNSCWVELFKAEHRAKRPLKPVLLRI